MTLTKGHSGETIKYSGIDGENYYTNEKVKYNSDIKKFFVITMDAK